MSVNLGFYFGLRDISIVQSKAKKILSVGHISQEKIIGSDIEEKVPQDIKTVALIKDELRKQGIDAKQAGLALSSKDLIVRSFDLPLLPRDELSSAVIFESKKYLPFKPEDLIFDFQIKTDKKEKKHLVLFLGIQKERVDYYFSIMSQLGMRAATLEYSAFSFLRLANLVNLNMKGMFTFIALDMEDESNFMVAEDGFPLFTRDMDLTTTDISLLPEKLKAEIQLSLDYYYHRKFPSKHIESIVFFAPKEYKDSIASLSQELDLANQFIDFSDYFNRKNVLALNALRAFSVSLSSTTKLLLKLDLISALEKTRIKAVGIREEIARLSLKDLQPEPKFLLLSVLVIIVSFLLTVSLRTPLQKRLAHLINGRPRLVTVSLDKTYEDLQAVESEYKVKLATMGGLLNRYPYLTYNLNALPQLLPDGTWLNELIFRQTDAGKEFIIKGIAYLEDHSREFDAINTFFSKIKKNQQFLKTFKVIEITSIEFNRIASKEVSAFVISCKG